MRLALSLLMIVLGAGQAGAQGTGAGAGSTLGTSQPALPPPRAAAPPATTPAAPTRATASRPPANAAPSRTTTGTTAGTARPTARPSQPARPAKPGAQRQTPQQAEAARQRRATAAAAAAAAAAATAASQAAAIAPVIPQDPQPTTGSVTGLPLPRFSALRSNDVNLRVGPERRFPVEWHYQRSDLPVQIIREHEQWRRIRDPEGAEGWIHASNLQPGRRTFLIRGAATAETPLRRRAEDDAGPVARLRGGVIGRIRGCDAGSAWCEVQVQDRRGYLKRSEMFGVLAEEEIK